MPPRRLTLRGVSSTITNKDFAELLDFFEIDSAQYDTARSQQPFLNTFAQGSGTKLNVDSYSTIKRLHF